MAPRERFSQKFRSVCQKCMDVQYMVRRLGSRDSICINAIQEMHDQMEMFICDYAPLDAINEE